MVRSVVVATRANNFHVNERIRLGTRIRVYASVCANVTIIVAGDANEESSLLLAHHRTHQSAHEYLFITPSKCAERRCATSDHTRQWLKYTDGIPAKGADRVARKRVATRLACIDTRATRYLCECECDRVTCSRQFFLSLLFLAQSSLFPLAAIVVAVAAAVEQGQITHFPCSR